jgi:hypothetical protein
MALLIGKRGESFFVGCCRPSRPIPKSFPSRWRGREAAKVAALYRWAPQDLKFEI